MEYGEDAKDTEEREQEEEEAKRKVSENSVRSARRFEALALKYPASPLATGKSSPAPPQLFATLATLATFYGEERKLRKAVAEAEKNCENEGEFEGRLFAAMADSRVARHLLRN